GGLSPWRGPGAEPLVGLGAKPPLAKTMTKARRPLPLIVPQVTPPLSLAVLLEQASCQTNVPIQLGLERVLRLLERMGNPQQELDCIHVAGTNGKGSVLAFLGAMLRHAGYRVGLYTSPHLHCVNERIQVAGQWITDDSLARWLSAVLTANAGAAATFFELLTVVAFCHFRDQGLGRTEAGRGIVLLETGLGGRLDATNVIEPLVSIITSISLDHTDYLGAELTAIATEKAGIFKPAVPALAASGRPEVEELLRRQAQKQGTPLAILGKEFFLCPPLSFLPPLAAPDGTIPADATWWFQEGGICQELPRPGLSGRHQLENAALAIAGVHRLRQAGWPVDDAAMVAGVRDARWPGRLERFSLPGQDGQLRTVLLDGAHNPSGCLSLANFLRESTSPDRHSTRLLFAAVQDKPVEEMARILLPYVDEVWVTRIGGERGYPAAFLAALWQGLGRPAHPCATPAEGLAAALAAAPPGGEVVVCGSLYLVGAVRAILRPDMPRDKIAFSR
ncbi:MAG: bifunctional folylpolyglutamate synthase/dihydrofolate synthase, partial [Magnetococcus sp. XQGC-1]